VCILLVLITYVYHNAQLKKVNYAPRLQADREYRNVCGATVTNAEVRQRTEVKDTVEVAHILK
jgi:hypothetical protein